MKSTSIILLFLLTGITAFSQETLQVQSKTESVTVYMNQAQVKASLVTNIPKGNSKIVITDLPATLDPNSIQVGGRGNFTLLSVNFEKDFISKRQQAYQDSLDTVQDDIDLLTMKLTVNKNEQEILMDNSEVKGDNEELKAEKMEAMSVYFRKRLLALGEERIKLTKELKILVAQKERIDKQMQSDPSRNLPMGKIILSVSADLTGRADLDLSYLVYDTGWTPTYDIRVKDTKSKLNLSYKAEVRQNTGTDWNNVKLTLSTAMVNRQTVKPELFPQYLQFYEERPPVVMRAKTMKDEDAVMAAPMEMEVASAANYAQLVETTLNRQFVISVPYTIKSGVAETVEVQKLDIPAKYVTYAVPRYDTNGFLIAEVEEWEKYGLLPASGNVYFEGGFVGKTYLSDPGVKEILKISLGRDERLEIERKELTEFKERKTFGSNIRENRAYRITLKNLRNLPLTVVVEDQIPVSQDSAIEVEVKDISGGTVVPETGIIRWELDLPGSSNKELNLTYEVKYPKDKRVLNL